MLEEKLTAGVLTYYTYEGVIQHNLVSDIAGYVNKYKLDIFLGPEWLFMPKERLYSKKEKENIIGELAEKTKRSNALIIPGSIMWEDDNFFCNTVPLISGGKLIGESHKSRDGGDTEKAIQRGCKKPFYDQVLDKVFKWEDYMVGIEICAEKGRLLDILEKSNAPLLDMYFFVSCGPTIHTSTELPIKEGYYALYSNGNYTPDCSALKKINKYNNDVLKGEKASDNLWLYNLTSKSVIKNA